MSKIKRSYNKGKDNPMYGTTKKGYWLGKKFSKETKKKMSENRRGEKHPMWGKHHSKETKEKMKLSHIGQFKGNKHPNWKGGTYQDVYGYIRIWNPKHPRTNSNGYVRKSYLVAEKKLGRYLYPHEITHHKNGIRNDNKPENIEVMTRGKHQSFHNKNREKYKEEK